MWSLHIATRSNRAEPETPAANKRDGRYCRWVSLFMRNTARSGYRRPSKEMDGLCTT